ncbi:MAG: AsmA family protein [Vibrio sp.]
MKKLLTFIISALLLVFITLATLFGLLNTTYATPIAQWINQLIGDDRLSFQKVTYDYPLHLRFTRPTIQFNNTSLTFQHLDLWFNPTLYEHDQWQIDSALFDGVSVYNTLPQLSEPSTFNIHQLAIHNLSIDTDDVSTTQLNVQIKQPHWYRHDQWLPYGKIQLSAESLQWQGEHIHKLLVDMNHQFSDSTINGFSFHWRNGLVSGQAEHYPSGWSLVNVTMNHLALTQNIIDQIHYKWDSVSPRLITHINSLDILNSQLELGSVILNNADLSIENWTINPLWQTQGELSLHADNAKWKGMTWIEPDLKLTISPGKITINDFIADIWQGNLQLAGTVTANKLHLSQLNINGVRWYGEHDEDFPMLSPEDLPWPTIQIDQLAFNNAQLVQLQHKPFWQLSGFSIHGQNLTLRHDTQFGLWQGKINLSANSASIGKLHTSQAIIEMRNDNQVWSLTRAFLPLKHGYFKAHGTWPMDNQEKPWSLNIQGDGLPLDPLNQWVSLPISLSGFADTEASFSGMTGNATLIKHTLSGSAQTNIYHGVMTMQQGNTTTIQPFGVDNIQLTADRGRITVPKTTIQGTTLDAALSGKFDLVDEKTGYLNMTETTQGHTTTYDLLHTREIKPPVKSEQVGQ